MFEKVVDALERPSLAAVTRQLAGFGTIRTLTTRLSGLGLAEEVALAAASGETQLRVSSGGGIGAYGLFDADAARKTIPVETVSGDTLVARGAPAPTVLKVDVQGAERAVLDGLSESIGDCRVVYCNIYEKHFDTAGDRESVHERLVEAGFHVDRFADWEGGYFLRAAREDEV